MKRVLIIGPDFTPSSLPPAIRIQGFVGHLPEFGWEPIVQTVDPDYYDWPVDKENERLLPQSLQVKRTKSLPPRSLRRIGIGDIALRSLWHQWRGATKLCKDENIDLVFTPIPPYYQALIGRSLNKRFGIPHVVDYIDPWVTVDFWNLPRQRRGPKRTVSYGLSCLMEPYVLKRSAHITGVSKGTTDHVIDRYSWLTPKDASEIPYGGETVSLDYLAKNPRQNTIFDKDDGLLHFSYIGACNAGMGPTIDALLQGVKLGLQKNPELFSAVRLHFVGTSYAADGNALPQVLPKAHHMGIGDLVDEQTSRVSYLDALQLLLDSDGLLVLGSDAPHYTPSKIFPYILARKPMLVVFHEESNVIAILKDVNAGTVVTFDTPSGPLSKVKEISDKFESVLSLPEVTTDWEAFEKYSTREMTKVLAQAFDRALVKEKRSKVSLAELSAT